MSDHTVNRVLGSLVAHGWVTLRSMSYLLGYAHGTGIYGRQRGKNPIPTVKVGGTYRVYEDTVIETLENAPERDQVASKTILRIYRQLKKEVADIEVQ